MTISIQDLVRLSRIGEELRRDDPELAGRLPRMNGRPRRWRAASYGVLTVSAVLALIGLVISNIPAFVAGGILLMTIYPALLGFSGRARGKRCGSGGDDRFGV
jgi:hypothetical protein